MVFCDCGVKVIYDHGVSVGDFVTFMFDDHSKAFSCFVIDKKYDQSIKNDILLVLYNDGRVGKISSNSIDLLAQIDSGMGFKHIFANMVFFVEDVKAFI